MLRTFHQPYKNAGIKEQVKEIKLILSDTNLRAVKILTVIVALSSVNACVSRQQIKEGAAKTASFVKGGVVIGVDKVKALTSGKLGTTRKKNREKALGIAALFPESEVPHTILVKPIEEGSLTSGFGYRLNPAGLPIPKGHKGVDYYAPVGTAIYAAESGVIVRKYLSTSLGNYIKIEHANGFATAYAHMHSFVEGMAEGVTVRKGQRIGTVGSTGRSTGPHLHFELLYYDEQIDPFFAKPLS